METPPRTWRRLKDIIQTRGFDGNTSTDVEKTHIRMVIIRLFKKHLHGRGEDRVANVRRTTSVETPPRTWRRLFRALIKQTGVGNTSTDVEKTRVHDNSFRSREKHLHGRGEDNMDLSLIRQHKETPPRTWRRPSSRLPSGDKNRNTSTDVEKTPLPWR